MIETFATDYSINGKVALTNLFAIIRRFGLLSLIALQSKASKLTVKRSGRVTSYRSKTLRRPQNVEFRIC